MDGWTLKEEKIVFKNSCCAYEILSHNFIINHPSQYIKHLWNFQTIISSKHFSSNELKKLIRKTTLSDLVNILHGPIMNLNWPLDGGMYKNCFHRCQIYRCQPRLLKSGKNSNSCNVQISVFGRIKTLRNHRWLPENYGDIYSIENIRLWLK